MEEDVNSQEDNTSKSKGVTFSLVFSVFACVIGTAFQHGYNTAVINPTGVYIKHFLYDVLEDRYNVNKTGGVTDLLHQFGVISPHSQEAENWVLMIYAFIVSIWTFGAVIGSFCAGALMDEMGRGGLMLLNNLGFIIGALLTMYGPSDLSYELMIGGRFITGFSCGIATAVTPIYLTEIAPVKLRGMLGEVDQITVVFGIVVAQAVGLPQVMGTSGLWPYLFGVPLLASLLQIICLPMCPESPRYLLINQKDEEGAKFALQKLRGANFKQDLPLYMTGSTGNVDDEIQMLKQEHINNASKEKVTACSMFTVKYVRRALLVAAMLNIGQQLSGINTVTYFSNSTFLTLGFSMDQAYMTTLCLYILQFVMVIISSGIIERVGRRLLLITGFSGMAFSAIILTICYNFMLTSGSNIPGYFMIVATCGFVGTFALGPGPIPWFIVGELFTQEYRSHAMALCTGLNWIANFAVAQSYPFMQKYLGDDSLIPFVLLNLMFATLTWAYLPETRGRPIEDIVNELKRKSEKNGYEDLDEQSQN